jgi:hypothetical protein
VLLGQDTHVLAPAIDENDPATQLMHNVSELAPSTPEYFPAEHPVHALADVTVE